MNDNEFRIGRVLGEAFAASWRNLGRWLALAALVQAPILFYTLLSLREHLPDSKAAMVIVATLHVAFYVLAQAAVTTAMFAHLRGQRVSLGALLGMVLRPAPLLWFAVVYGLVSGFLAFAPHWLELWSTFWYGYWVELGYDALLYLFIAVTVPVLVNERTGALEALKRNVSLTAKNRGRLFGIYLLLAVAGWLMFSLAWRWVDISVTTDSVMENIKMWSLASAVVGPVIWGAVNASIYRTLRLVREGVDITSTPSVPDARIHTAG